MARPKATAISGIDDITQSLISDLNKEGTGTQAYLQGSHAQHTWGPLIPHLAFQWLVGGINVLPCQRHIGVSGLPKSFKSTLLMDIGNWYLRAGGMHVALDNEGKTSASMLDAITAYDPETEKLAVTRRIFKETNSVEEWQSMVTAAIKRARKVADRPKGQRIPILITIDSLNGKSSDASADKIKKEGSADARAFPVEAAQITRFFKGTGLIGTTANIGYVQHMVQDLGAPPGYGGPAYKESGAAISSYQGSVHLRVKKGQAYDKASHPAARIIGPPIEGYTLWLQTERSCLGPDHRTLGVDVLWQYIDREDGPPQQLMWYDWDGALGRLLVEMAYNDKMLHAFDRDRLEATLDFTQPTTGHVNCKELGLEDVSFTEFGKAIQNTPEVREKITKYLRIFKYPDVQEADVELGVGEESETE